MWRPAVVIKSRKLFAPHERASACFAFIVVFGHFWFLIVGVSASILLPMRPYIPAPSKFGVENRLSLVAENKKGTETDRVNGNYMQYAQVSRIQVIETVASVCQI